MPRKFNLLFKFNTMNETVYEFYFVKAKKVFSEADKYVILELFDTFYGRVTERELENMFNQRTGRPESCRTLKRHYDQLNALRRETVQPADIVPPANETIPVLNETNVNGKKYNF